MRTTHQEFGSRITEVDGSAASNDNHATHVGGTIAARGAVARAKGMATGALIRSYDWNSDVAELTTAASQGLLLSNHSYGYDTRNIFAWYFGAYDSKSAN